MIHQASQQIYDTLKAKELKAFIQEERDASIVSASFPLDGGASFQIRFLSLDEDNDVAVRTSSILRVKEHQVKTILPVINRLNSQYRFAKFVLDDDLDVIVQYDLPLRGNNVGECALEMAVCFVKVIQQTYADLMRTIWQ